MEKSPLIHIGYQKTGSTWLRQHIFDNANLGFVSPFSRIELLEQLVYPHALDFDPVKVKSYFSKKLEPAFEAGLHPVISLERLSGNPVSGGYDTKELADRIALIFPESKIMIVIREQKAMILSSYKEYVKSGGPASLIEYLNPPPPKRIPYFDFNHYQYHRLIAYYQKLFGDANVITMLYEQFRQSPQNFVIDLIDSLCPENESSMRIDLPFQERSNKGLSSFELALKRRLNFWIGERNSLNLNSLFPTGRFERVLFYGLKYVGFYKLFMPLQNNLDAKLTKQIHAQTGERYRSSNRKTGLLIHRNLADYGYDV